MLIHFKPPSDPEQKAVLLVLRKTPWQIRYTPFQKILIVRKYASWNYFNILSFTQKLVSHNQPSFHLWTEEGIQMPEICPLPSHFLTNLRQLMRKEFAFEDLQRAEKMLVEFLRSGCNVTVVLTLLLRWSWGVCISSFNPTNHLSWSALCGLPGCSHFN